jgi:hypothetical protein
MGNTPVIFLERPLGINTMLAANQLSSSELVVCNNFMYDNTGAIVTRPGLVKTTNTSVGKPIVKTGYVTIDGTNYTLLVDSDFYLYYLDGSNDPIQIGSLPLEGKPEIIPFGGYAVFTDTGYLKIWDGTTLRLAYDTGNLVRSYSSGFQFDSTTLTSTSGIKVGNSNLYRGAYKFTTQAWSTGWTIPPFKAVMSLTRVGTIPSTVFSIKIRRVSDDHIMASVASLSDGTDTYTTASSLKNTETVYTATFTADDISTELSPETDYYLTFEWNGGDSSNYIQLVTANVTSGGAAYSYTAGVYTNVPTETPLMSLSPGRPPKASMGEVKDDRLWLAGSDDAPGYAFFSNVSSPLDFSSDSAAGYTGVIDNTDENYPIGAMLNQFGNLYFIGKAQQPFFTVLTGTSPTDFSITERFKHLSSEVHLAVNAVHDSIFCNKNGAFTLSGVEQYGDLRFANIANPIRNNFSSYFNSSGFIEYNSNTAQVFIKFENSELTFIGHVDLASEAREGIRTPWTTYSFGNLTPSSFTFMNGNFYIGMTNGHIYRLTDGAVNDDGESINYFLTTGILELPFDSEANVERLNLGITNYGASGTFDVFFRYPGEAEFVLETGYILESGYSFEAVNVFNINIDTSTTAPYDVWANYNTQQIQWGIKNVVGCGKLFLSAASLDIRQLKN